MLFLKPSNNTLNALVNSCVMSILQNEYMLNISALSNSDHQNDLSAISRYCDYDDYIPSNKLNDPEFAKAFFERLAIVVVYVMDNQLKTIPDYLVSNKLGETMVQDIYKRWVKQQSYYKPTLLLTAQFNKICPYLVVNEYQIIDMRGIKP